MKLLTYPGEAGLFLREQRQQQGLDQTDFSEVVGTTQSAVSEWETGVAGLTLDKLLVVSAALGYRVALVPFEHEEAADAR